MTNFSKSKSKPILVVSGRPILREVLKNLLEEAGWDTVVSSLEWASLSHLIAEVSSSAVVIDRPNISLEGLDCLFEDEDQMVNVVIVSWDDDKLATCCRGPLQPATRQKLIEAINQITQSI